MPSSRKVTTAKGKTRTKKAVQEQTASGRCSGCYNAIFGITEHCAKWGPQHFYDKLSNGTPKCTCKCRGAYRSGQRHAGSYRTNTCFEHGCLKASRHTTPWGWFCNEHHAELLVNLKKSYPWLGYYESLNGIEIKAEITPRLTPEQKQKKAVKDQKQIIETWKNTLKELERM